MSLAAGDKLGPYEILAPLGAGGMGEVYRARDTTLKRDVALKVLPAAFVRDHERMARFQREAEVLASLDHPNIGPIYGLVDSEDSRTLVLALIEGPTLADRIAAGAMPPEEALHVAKQIIEALEYARDRGVVHRDLKPANIKITSEGVVKVLDFGLAKVLEDEPPKSSLTNSPTLTLGHTRAGVILGTAAYMSPEQAVGRPVDRRSDIFSFGAVLYEMLTGKRAFAGATTPDVLEAVVKGDPDWSALPAGTPAYLRRLLERCLAKDRKQRLQSIGEARIALENPRRDDPPSSTSASQSRPGWVLATTVLALALAVLAFVHFREQPPVAEVTRFQIPLPANENFSNPLISQEVSPDGRKLAFETVGADGKVHLWIRWFDSLEARLLQGVEVAGSNAFFWSPDSRSLAFQSSDNKLKRVDVSGGPAQTICDVTSVDGGSWNRDGVILFGGSAIMRVSDEGGTPTALTALDPARQEIAHLFPKLLPDGRHFLYFRGSNTPGNNGIYVGSIDAKPGEQSSKPLVVNSAFPEYYLSSGNSNTGYLLFFREGTVLAQVFYPNTLELSGSPIPIAEQIDGLQGLIGFFSASTNGVLVYVRGNASSTGNVQLAWFDREGKNLGTVGEPGAFVGAALSKDGKQAAVSRISSLSNPKANLWLLDLTPGGLSRRFTFGAYLDQSPVWSPDGSSIVFNSRRDGSNILYRKSTNGIKDEELLLESDEPKTPSSISPDGRYLLYTLVTSKTKADPWILTLDGSHKSMPFQVTEFNEDSAKFSPDGRWIAYESDDSGRREVYVREFLLGSDGKPEATQSNPISNGGGINPYWRDGGKAVIYGSLDAKTGMLAEITSLKPVFHSSPAKALGKLPLGADPVDITTDGKRVLAKVPVGQTGPQQFTVVQNWPAGLKK